jgi:hypothetical protein
MWRFMDIHRPGTNTSIDQLLTRSTLGDGIMLAGEHPPRYGLIVWGARWPASFSGEEHRVPSLVTTPNRRFRGDQHVRDSRSRPGSDRCDHQAMVLGGRRATGSRLAHRVETGAR